MSRLAARLRHRLKALVFGSRMDADLDEELRFHLDHLTTQYRRAGHSEADARRQARLDLDGVIGPREAARDARGLRRWGELRRDVRLAARGLARSPGFTATTVGTLALGLSLFVAASAVARAYLLSPLPAPGSDRLFHVWYAATPGQGEPGGLRTLDWGGLSDVVELADATIFTRYLSTDGGTTREWSGLRVPAASLGELGLQVVEGRQLTGADSNAALPSMLLGHHIWHDRFGARADIVGTTLTLAPAGAVAAPLRFRVVGVAAPGFRYVREYSRPPVDFITLSPDAGVAYMVRLRPGVDPREVERRIDATIRTTTTITPPDSWRGVRLESVHERFVEPIRPALSAAWVGAMFLMTLVVANIAILVLLRQLRRQREAAVRVALGASRRHLIRSAAIEGALVGIAAAVPGLTVSAIALDALDHRLAGMLGRVPPDAVLTTPAMLGVVGLWLTVALAAAWAILGALAFRRAAWHHMRDGRSTTDRPAVRWSRVGFLAVQVTASIALVGACVVMLQSATRLLRVDLGLSTERVWRSRLALAPNLFPNRATIEEYYQRLLSSGDQRRLTIGLANWPLFVEAARPQQVWLQGDASRELHAAVTAVTAGYLEALAIPTLSGRPLQSIDRPGSEPVAVVSASFAARAWPGASPIGQRVRTVDRALAGADLGPWRNVVGVVGDVRQMPTDEDRLDVYVPFLQAPGSYAVVATTSSAGGIDVPALFEQVAAGVDSRAIVGPVVPLQGELDRLTATPRALAGLLTIFGVVAVVLTMLGVYGVIAHAVRQREAELAIRMALGASPRRIAVTMLGTAAQVLAIAGPAGALTSVALGRLLASSLHDVSGAGLQVTGLAILGTAACVFLASLAPIRRALRISPARLLSDL